MSKVPYLAAHRDKKAGKEECFNIIRRMANGDSHCDYDLAALYSYFLPPKPRKISNPFEWAASICDDKANYAFCKYIECSNGMVVSANTKVSHIVFSDLELVAGFYDTGKGYVGDDVAIMPDCIGVMSESQTDGKYEGFDLESLDILDTPSGLVYIMPWNGKGVPKNYLDSLIKSVDNAEVYRNNDGPFCVIGTVKSVSVCAVIMPGEVTRV